MPLALPSRLALRTLPNTTSNKNGESMHPCLTTDGASGQCHTPAVLYPWVPIGQEAEWATEPVWTQRVEEKSFASARD
jgi:hypothetical protein